MEELNTIQRISIWLLPVLLAITVHEVAHGWMAKKLGDKTAEMMGRLTLNPLKHIDPVGTLLVPGFLMLVGGFIFGWAKPVPITWENLKNPRRDVALVALAGPISNFIMALFWALAMKIGMLLSASIGAWVFPLVLMGSAGVTINLILMALNLLPILPLDGGRVVSAILPGKLSYQFAKLEPYGLFIILGLFFFGGLSWLLSPPVNMLRDIIHALVGLH
ncbi:MAG TPA: site-2 protease family protein [Gammaproteobacteria bacterium]|nr:site-2 protease family protein [Gammaproteobacteria bacterium]